MENSNQSTPAMKKDLDWIKKSLQDAVELEYSTLPVYLSSMFSLEVQNYTAYNLIRSVAMEEMVHMAIAANILAAIGGKPQFKNIKIPYPVQGLPGGAEPDLHIGLTQLSKNQLKNFLRIEMPDFLLQKMNRSETYTTIAVFYNDICQAMKENAEEIRTAVKNGGTSNQVGDNIGFTTIKYTPGVDPLDTIFDGIKEILEQGEGASTKNLITTNEFESEESHYARFAEIYYGATYEEPTPPVELTAETEPMFFKGRPVGWPVVINTLAVPSDGYAKILALDPDKDNVEKDLSTFDNSLSSILSELEEVWNGPASTSWKTLGGAVHNMVDLRVLSCFNIMRHEIPKDIISNLSEMYPDEFDYFDSYSDLKKPVYYGPRFINTN